MTKTTVILDADDVMFAFETQARALLAYLDIEAGPDGNDMFGGEENKRRFGRAIDARVGWVYNMPLLHGVVDALSDLRGLGVKVLCATRPYSKSTIWYNERRQALIERLGFRPKELYFCADKSHIWGHAFVDNDPRHIQAWQAQWPSHTAVLWDTPSSRGVELPEGSLRAVAWSQVISLARALVNYNEAAK